MQGFKVGGAAEDGLDRDAWAFVCMLMTQNLCLAGALRAATAVAEAADRYLPLFGKPAAAERDFADLARALPLSITGNYATAASIASRVLDTLEGSTGDVTYERRLGHNLLAQLAVWQREASAGALAAVAAGVAVKDTVFRFEAVSQAARLQGTAALDAGDLVQAEQHLQEAITVGRTKSHVTEELAALAELAWLRLKQGQVERARQTLDEIWEGAERGPYRLKKADACAVLEEIEQQSGNANLAVEAATQAFTEAWCDGPPYAYAFGLQRARHILADLGAPEPVVETVQSTKLEARVREALDSAIAALHARLPSSQIPLEGG